MAIHRLTKPSQQRTVDLPQVHVLLRGIEEGPHPPCTRHIMPQPALKRHLRVAKTEMIETSQVQVKLLLGEGPKAHHHLQCGLQGSVSVSLSVRTLKGPHTSPTIHTQFRTHLEVNLRRIYVQLPSAHDNPQHQGRKARRQGHLRVVLHLVGTRFVWNTTILS